MELHSHIFLYNKKKKNSRTHFHAQLSGILLKLFLLFLLDQYFQYILGDELCSTNYLTKFSFTYNFSSLNTHQNHMIYHIHIHNN